MKITIKMKLIVFFLLIGLVPAITIGVLSLNQASTAVEDEAYSKLELFAGFTNDSFNSFFDVRLADVEQLAARNVIRDGLQAYVDDSNNFNNEEFRFQLDRFAVFAEESMAQYAHNAVILINTNGDVIYTTNPALEGSNLSNRAYFQEAMRNNVQWSEYEYSDIIDENYISVAAPVLTQGTDTVIGVISLIITGDEIEAMLHEKISVIGETADVYLVNADGLLLTNTVSGQYAEGAALKHSLSTDIIKSSVQNIKSSNYGSIENGLYDDYTGVPVIGELAVVRLGEEAVGLIIEIDQDEAFKNINTIRNFVLAILGISVPIIGVAGIAIANTFSRPIFRVQQVLSQVGNNDLTAQADVSSNDEIGQMAEDLNTTIYKLNESLNQVKQAVENVSHGSEEIAAGNQDLSQRTEEQASSLEEIASTIEEITSSMEASSSNAIEADNLSKRTLETVQDGENVVANLQESMVEITKGSHEISEIIATVNDIAFQTNLLALNAAVEAARAGEQGRGFSVVASEVRNLAGRSAEAAKEIEKLIKNSIEKVDRGNEQMKDTQRVLNAIVDNTKKTTDVVGEISASLREQTFAATDIRKAIDELNQVTQQNASLVEEIASSSENMSSEAITLAKLVSIFKLNSDSNSNNSPVSRKPVNATKARMVAEPKRLPATKQIASAKKDSYKKDKFESDEYDFNEQDFEKF
jgi:methyl-accepting chemotaxis protein